VQNIQEPSEQSFDQFVMPLPSATNTAVYVVWNDEGRLVCCSFSISYLTAYISPGFIGWRVKSFSENSMLYQTMTAMGLSDWTLWPSSYDVNKVGRSLLRALGRQYRHDTETMNNWIREYLLTRSGHDGQLMLTGHLRKSLLKLIGTGKKGQECQEQKQNQKEGSVK